MTSNRSEAEVLAGILQYLNIRSDIWYWRSNTGVAKFKGRLVRFGTRGQADILCVQAPSGRLIGLEIKREVGGTQSLDQKRWGRQLVAFGGVYAVVRSVAEVQAVLGTQTVSVIKP